MKTTITPSIVSRLGMGKPLLTIHKKGATFNKSACLLLALKPGSRFVLEAEGRRLFYVDKAETQHDTFQVGYLRAGAAIVSNVGLLPYLQDNPAQINLLYQIGEMHEGSRELFPEARATETLEAPNGLDRIARNQQPATSNKEPVKRGRPKKETI